MTTKIKKQVINKRYSLYCGDCCEVIKAIPDESIDFSIFSPPFCSLYAYSDENADMGNSKSYDEFFAHFDFLVKELYRVLSPGRNIVVHCMDLPINKQDFGYIGFRDFPGDIIRAFLGHNFIYHSPRICIWKDPLLEAVRTKALGLAHKQIVKDSSMCRSGIPDVLLTFRKPGENTKPIAHPDGLTEYYGSREMPRELDHFLIKKVAPGKNKRSHWIWQQYASSVWLDIRQTRVMPYRGGRDGEDQKHICPLQLDTIERCMALWTRPGDVVFTPFMGVGSEVFVAVKNKRLGIGVELKESYYNQAVRNVKSVCTYKRASLLV